MCAVNVRQRVAGVCSERTAAFSGRACAVNVRQRGTDVYSERIYTTGWSGRVQSGRVHCKNCSVNVY